MLSLAQLSSLYVISSWSIKVWTCVIFTCRCRNLRKDRAGFFLNNSLEYKIQISHLSFPESMILAPLPALCCDSWKAKRLAAQNWHTECRRYWGTKNMTQWGGYTRGSEHITVLRLIMLYCISERIWIIMVRNDCSKLQWDENHAETLCIYHTLHNLYGMCWCL